MTEDQPTPSDQIQQVETPAESKKRRKTEYMRRWREKNRDHFNQFQRDWRAKTKDARREAFDALPEEDKAEVRGKWAAKRRREYRRNRPAIDAANQRWEEKNKERHRAWMRQYQKQWQKENREWCLAWRRARYRHNKRPQTEKGWLKLESMTIAELADWRIRKHQYNQTMWRKWRVKLRRGARAFYWKNRERLLEVMREYARSPRGRHAKQEGERRRRARMRGPGVTFQEWQDLLKAWDYRCFYCRKLLVDGDRTMDHVQPVSRGGIHAISNILPACRRCNSRKGSRDIMEFAHRVMTEAFPDEASSADA